MFCMPRRRKKPEDKAVWRVFNFGTDMEFAECSCCEYTIDDYDPYDMPMRCPECNSDIGDVEFV